ncbi:hypothetical protein [Fodinicola feengrottensis]|uniref:hypothetical protein n=1 Tax=Fodinicola feengrottensis TaxID=435914 RepID=UPI002442D651|nr:hypothetical protein [Fodinicola feengrottensis]
MKPSSQVAQVHQRGDPGVPENGREGAKECQPALSNANTAIKYWTSHQTASPYKSSLVLPLRYDTNVRSRRAVRPLSRAASISGVPD